MARLFFTTVIAGLIAAACSDAPPASSAPPTAGGEAISGTERIGWTQTAPSAAEVALYRYAIYVNGDRRLLENAACATTVSANGFACDAPLPTLTPGPHTLEVAAFITAAGGAIVEGPRSTPLRVTVSGSTAAAGPAWPDRVVSADGLAIDLSVVADDLTDPQDLAVTGSGVVLVAERGGRIRTFPGGEPAPGAGGASVLDSFRRDGETELLSLAVPSDFERTGLVYFAVGAARDDDRTIAVARGRAVRGVIGEIAVLSVHPVPAEANAVLRVGPDGHLYAGVGTGSDPPAAQRLTEAAGKVLRLRDDGGIPETNPWSSAVWSVGHRDPRGLVWRGDTLWQAERDEDGDEINVIRRGANYGWPLVRAAASHPHVTRPSFILPAGTEVSGVTAVTLRSSPFADSLIVAARGGSHGLLRVRLETGRRQQAVTPLSTVDLGPVAQVAGDPDGSIWFITAHGAGEGHDVLVRLSPIAASPRP